ncbi:MAG: hypothetical protein ACYTFK_04670 [Planctomycetota bacterium]|jgi:hypothetical protein
MSKLSKEEKDVILDFYFRCGDQERIDQGRDLIAGNPEAAELYAKLADTLTDLDSVKYEPCPDNLVDITVAKLKLAASSEQVRLGGLLAAEQKKTAKMETSPATTDRSFWRNIIEVAAVAAMIMVVTGVSLPSLSRMRQASLCRTNLKNMGQAIASYVDDNNGALPSVTVSAGSPWWNVGEQGAKNRSNTRHVWLLVKKGYLDGNTFICPGRKDAGKVNYTRAQLANYNDFPSRKNFSYSFRFMCDKIAKSQKGSGGILMADLNPVFEQLFDEDKRIAVPDENTRILLNEQLLKIMSTNHRGRGQNILFYDGSCEFKKTRQIFGDDIYTVRGAQSYSGKEVPCDENDVFLAP